MCLKQNLPVKARFLSLIRWSQPPHLGASTTEAQEKVALQVAEQMADYLNNGAVSNALNMASVTAEEAPVLKPYMALGKLLASQFVGQVEF